VHFKQFKRETIEGSSEKGNKTNYLEHRNEVKSNFIQLYFIIDHQIHFDIGKNCIVLSKDM